MLRYFLECWNAVVALLGDTAVFKAFVKTPFPAKINVEKCCRQVRFSSSNFTNMRLHSGLYPGPQLGAVDAPPGPLAGF